MTNPEFGFVRPEGGRVHIPVPVVNMDSLDHSTASAWNGSVTSEEDQCDAFFIPQPTRHVIEVLPDPTVERLHTLE